MKRKDLAGIGGIIILTVVIAVVFSANAESIYGNSMFNATLQNIDQTLQTMDTLDEKLQYLMAVGSYPSVVAGIVVNDSLVWANAYGAARLDTVYLIASITKPFTATAILQLYERNLLDLETDVNAYLPFQLRHPQYPNTPITIRMLLAHQSGIGHPTGYRALYNARRFDAQWHDWVATNLGWEFPKFDPMPSLETFLEACLTPTGTYYSPTFWRSFEPGTGFSYSSIGYDLLGYVVSQVAQQPFTAYLQEHIWEPLNMTRTGFRAAEFAPNHAIPYERIFGILSKTNLELPLYELTCEGGTGIRTTLPDLAQFLLAHMNDGRVNGFQLLQPETVELMHQPAVSLTGGWEGYGFGWILRSKEPGKYHDMKGSQGHGGSDPGFISHMWMVERDPGAYGIILMTNLNTNFKEDALWSSATDLKMQDILLHEASVLFSHGYK